MYDFYLMKFSKEANDKKARDISSYLGMGDKGRGGDVIQTELL